ncbi:MAG: hypothetical protein CUN55_10475 [Phototrophicales bacterium]|nr:MAG: hypothetical protein CUN55_10475 [Phototrophicales bacterium]
MTEQLPPQDLPEDIGGVTQPHHIDDDDDRDDTPDPNRTPVRPAVAPPPPEPLVSPQKHEPYMRSAEAERTQEAPRPDIYSQNTMPIPVQGVQPQKAADPLIDGNVPASVSYKRKRRQRKSMRRGCAISPSCLIGCFGVISVTIIAILFGGWLTYRSYTSNLNTLLDDFDVRIEERDFGTTFIYDRNGTELGKFAEQGRRERVPIEEIPDVVIYATIALEDDSFYENSGVDFSSILRALRDNLLQGEIVSGASTITQQVVRNLLFDEQRRYEQSITRKIDEALLAITLTRRMSKDDILELYLNEINYGNGAYGIEAAAQVYFGKSARDLQLHEAALLVGIPQSPSLLDPLSSDPLKRQAILQRQQLVLDLMVEEGYITKEQAEFAKQQPLVFVQNEVRFDNAPHFMFYSKDEVLAIFAERYEAQGYLPEDAEKLAQQLFDSGLRVYTTLDLGMQRIAENAARTNVAQLRDRHDLTNASVVVIEPRTGKILAMVGSIDFNDESIDGQVNVSLAQRQPGSTMKIFTYSAAIERGWVPAQIIWDTNISIGIPGQPTYEPQNYDRREHGPVHLRDALANSYNIPAVQTLRFVGVQYLLDFMHRLGVKSLNRGAENYGLSLTLGGGEVTLLELTTAYGVYANMGQYVAPQAILCIVDDDDNSILYEYAGGCPEGIRTENTISVNPAPRTVLDPRVAFLMSDILSDNAARTPAMGANSPLNTGSLLTSVKTGTTNDFRDNWTVGYTSDIVVGVWSGNSDNRPMINISGLQGAAPIWRDTIQGIYNNYQLPPPQLVPPSGMYQTRICNVRQLRDPATDCPAFRQEWFFETQVMIPDSNGNLLPANLPINEAPPSQYGPLLEEVQPGIIRTWVRPLTPDQVNFFLAAYPNSAPQKYCLVPQEILSSVPDSQLLLFAKPPEDPEDAKRAYQYALNPSINYAILPQFACTPETISGGLPTSIGAGDWEVNPTSQYPARTAAIYCKADGSIEVYEVINSVGQLAFVVTPADIAAVGFAPGENRLIRSGGQLNVRLYRLGTGEFQVNAPANGDPNGYVHIWGGC